jgi:peptidyl-prolyl cis-trans isomerase B (cyclophilin B)
MKLWLSLCLSVGLLFASEASIAQAAAISKNVQVIIHTTAGPIKLVLDVPSASITTKNFLFYVKEGFYNDTIFHRVISNFMIQGGGFLPGMKEKTPKAAPIQNEGGQCGKNTRGSIAMARTSDRDSATSQFFINVVDNPFLDFQSETMQGWGYCAFGHVTEGMDVVDKIRWEATTNRAGFQDVPVNDVVIKSVEMV